jgi:hypothetical protein
MALLGAGCTRCGKPYAVQGIQVLAQREGIAFVQLVCFACQTQTLALVTGAPATEDDGSGLGEGILGDLLAGDRDGDPEGPSRPGSPISEVDVLEMRAYLAEYEGDVSGLFEGSADQGAQGSEPGGDSAGDDKGAAG